MGCRQPCQGARPTTHHQTPGSLAKVSGTQSFIDLTGFLSRDLDLLLFEINFKKNMLIYIVTFDILAGKPDPRTVLRPQNLRSNTARTLDPRTVVPDAVWGQRLHV